MSAKSRRLLYRTQKSSIRNSPFVMPSSIHRTSKNSVAFEFKCESINSSVSSVFSDNEAVPEKKKKKTGRTKKIRNTEDLRDCFKEPDNTDSVSDSETALKKVVIKSKTLIGIPISAPGKTKKRRKPIFTFPDVTSSFKSDSTEIANETEGQKGKLKKKIRHTQDLNDILNDNRESDVAVKSKSKRTKRARLPSFLPPVYMMDENKKLNRSKSTESSMADSDNKENDTNTESSGNEGNFSKTRRGRSRKAKKKCIEYEENVTRDCNQEDIVSTSTNKSEDNVFVIESLDNKNYNWSSQESIENNNKLNTPIQNKSILKQSRQSKNKNNSLVFENNFKDSHGNNSYREVTRTSSESTQKISIGSNIISSSHVDSSINIVDVMVNQKTQSEDEAFDQQIQLDQKRSVGKRKSKRNTFEVLNSLDKHHQITSSQINESININSEIAEDQNLLKRNTFNLSDREASNIPNKTGNTSDFNNESMPFCSEINQEQNEATHDKSIKKFLKRATDIASNVEETDGRRLNGCRRSTRNRTIESVPNLKTSSSVSKLNSSIKSLRTSIRASNSVQQIDTFSTRGSRSDCKRSTFDVNDSEGITPESELVMNLALPFEQDRDEKYISLGDTNEVLTPSKYTKTRSSKTVSSDEDLNKNNTIIDLTESVLEDTEPSPIRKPKRSTFTLEKRKSSFEVSFQTKKDKKQPEEILDHLNITRRDSRKSSFKKSSAGLKYSTGSEDDDTKTRGNFVTLRRGCHTMIDFDTGDSWDHNNGGESGRGCLKKFKNLENLDRDGSEGKIGLMDDKSSPEATASCNITEAIKKSVPRKSVLKKSTASATRSIRRDTFEIAECFYETLENQSKPAVSLITEATPNVTLEPQRDIFELVSRTPTAEIGKLMIGSGESLIVNQSFLHDTNLSVMPGLTRTSTFTKHEMDESPMTARKSTRKRWSQVERTPIFNKTPRCDSSIVANQLTDTTLERSVNKSKCVTIKTPPDFSPRKWNSSLKTTARESKAKGKGKKSVKIETPVKTPTIRMHSPLVARKTPRPEYSGTDSSILAGNCAYKPSTKLSPPSSTSTPYPKKKEVSLLQKVLTSEKNKSEKSIGKNSVRSKMPNFAKIHQRQFEKMENLREMQERKAVRAQYLLSGSKPPANTSAPGIVEKESRKQLMFSPKQPGPSKIASDTGALKVGKADKSKPLSKPLQHMLNKRASLDKQKKRASLDKQKKQVKSKVPVAVAKPVAVPTAKAKAPLNPEPKSFSRFGFKLPSGKENVTKDEQIKAVTTKSKIAGNRTETNRKQLGGVRSNRRFELLMKMRQNKNKLPANTISSRGIKYKYEPRKQVNLAQIKANPPENVTLKPSGSKHIPKSLQHMLEKKALKEKTKNQVKSKIPVNIFRSKGILPEVLKGNRDLEAKSCTRFGFKLPLGRKTVTKAEQIKAVSMKSKITRDRTEENRSQLRRVRSNRRFELLMKMRESNK